RHEAVVEAEAARTARAARGRPAPLAGRRPRLVRTRGDLGRTVAKALLAVLAVAAIVIGVLWAWDSKVEDGGRAGCRRPRYTIWPQYDPVRPASAVLATTSIPGHRPRAAFDRDWNTFWVTRPGQAIGARLIVQFKPASDIDKIGIFAGDP